MNDRITPFEGIAGHVMRRSISFFTFVTGLALTLIIFVITFICVRLEFQNAAGPILTIITSVVLARFALNGYAGEWDGSFLSDAGGSLIDAMIVAARYIVLSLVWIVPMVFIDPSHLPTTMDDPTTVKVTFGLIFLVLFLGTMSPPVFLIVATSAEKFSDIFRPAQWKAVFAGRLRDLFHLYVIYLGAVLMVIVSLVPFGILLALASWKVLLGVSLVFVLPFLVGFTLAFLGRMCGFFVVLSMDPHAETFRELVLARSASPGQRAASQPSTVPRVQSRTTEAPAEGPAPAQPDESPSLPRTTSPGVPIRTSPGTEVPRKPPLMDARDRVQAAMTRFDQNPQGAIRVLEELRRDYAPSPHVLHGLCLALARAGDAEGAIEVSREALLLCFERGNLRLAADIHRALISHATRLGVTRDQTLAIANSHRETKDLRASAHTYASVIRVDPGETRAIKGLLQVAQAQLQTGGDPQEALRLFDYMLHHCGDSPLAEFMKQGKAEAERKLAR